jgi:hypothetical protein
LQAEFRHVKFFYGKPKTYCMLLGFFPRCKKIFFLISLLTMSCIAMAQRVVNGSILDENQKPVSDATVSVKGTNRQTLTNQNGKFSIEARRSGDDTELRSL